MKYIEQTHKDLRLYLLEDSPDKSIFTIISESSFQESIFDINFGILAESHFVTVKTGNNIIAEICACTDFDVPNIANSLLTKIGDTNKVTETETLKHSFNYKVHNMAVGKVKLKALQSKRPHPYSYYLDHCFPSSKPGEESPVTEIYVTIDKDVLIESVHTYPNKDAMVFTTSTISQNN